MFSRRKRSRSSTRRQPLSGPPPSQSAQTAASHAFLNSNPGSNLSSAAAAAALRSMTPTPTAVENVQTRRMAQRQGVAPSPPNVPTSRRSASVSTPLRRSNSSSSMTARTFRENSPHRPSTSSGPTDRRHVPVDVPPLPSVPAKFASQSGSTRRSVSMDPLTRSSTVSSNPAALAASAASPRRLRVQTDQGPPSSPSSQHSTHNRVVSLGALSEIDRPSSRNSINFSYPRGSRPTSPTPTSPTQSFSSSGSSIKPIREKPKSAPAAQDVVRDRPSLPTSELPTENQGGSQATTSSSRPEEIAAGASSPATQPSYTQSNGSVKQAERVDQAMASPSTQKQHPQQSMPSIDTGFENPQPHTSPRAVLVRMPSTVKEETEPRDDEADPFITKGTDSLHQTAPVPGAQKQSQSMQKSSPPSSPNAPRDSSLHSDDVTKDSHSPGRSARFSTYLPVASAGTQLHEPPPRSVSPGKSALKNSRGTSLSPDRGHGSGRIIQPPSEISDGTSIASDEGLKNSIKKRPGKVSFDEEAEVVGVAASPPTSPEEYTADPLPIKAKSRMSWLGVGKKRASSSEHGTGSNEYYDVITPRQALPSFGSVRSTRPSNVPTPAAPQFSDNESSSSSDEDAAISKSYLANPQLISDGGTQAESQARNVSALENLSVTGSSALYQPGLGHKNEAKTDPLTGFPEKSSSSIDTPVKIHVPPAIAIEPATPPVETDQPGFGSATSLNQRKVVESHQSPSSAAPNVHESDDESSDSVYSDAPEDLDGDGFGSINAIVDSPSVPHSPVSPTHNDSERSAVRRDIAADERLQNASYYMQDQSRPFTPTQISGQSQMKDSPTNLTSSGSNHTGPLQAAKELEPSSSIQSALPDAGLEKPSRPVSGVGTAKSQVNTSYAKAPNGGPATQRPASLGPAFQMKKQTGSTGSRISMHRTMSNGSDSSSSFKRGKSGARSDGAFAMRRTMRGSAMRPQESPTVARPESPDDWRPTSSQSGNGTMRKSLRGPGKASEKTSFFSTNNKGARGQASKGAPASKSLRRSRFVDSDDEADAAPSHTFRSRFADSSDEDEPVNNTMRPVRGIPRRQGMRDGDSTDLEDSSEDERRPQVPVARVQKPSPAVPSTRDKAAPNMSGLAAVAKQRGMSQRELEEFMMSSPRSRKPGFLTRIGLKKSKHPENRVLGADTADPAHGEAPPGRTRLKREPARVDSYNDGTNGNQAAKTTEAAERQEPIASPRPTRRLSKRHTTDGSQWPLPVDAQSPLPRPVPAHSQSHSVVPAPETVAEGNGQPLAKVGERSGTIPPIQEESEPAQLNGVGPELGSRGAQVPDPAMTEQSGPSARDVVISGSGRKKRFPFIRKAFGLRG
ncbi:Uncharacterized protein PECH_005896 [Penicillium ucsense]|uniref:Uncharacterized protein n=1 Tax=Penicillium ucsense TaxID=2839758 RepID=A0A8J8WLL6_9EURO|nr:Uncharacterized protein PECM_000691 [Penicillium ucsense]KAF7736078.1 Uncharacterized protein PECH_005896 [Penicillium ucsense]